MERTYAGGKFTSVKIASRKDGFSGRELVCEEEGTKRTVAKVVFWDADGQFSIETMGELPLVVLEEFISEAKTLTPY